METGGHGVLGALAAEHVEEELKLAPVYATIQPQPMEVPLAQAVLLSHRLATQQLAQLQIQVS